MGSRLSKNILQIGLIESGRLAKFWGDWRSATKVIANFLLSFRVKHALVIVLNFYLIYIEAFTNFMTQIST